MRGLGKHRRSGVCEKMVLETQRWKHRSLLKTSGRQFVLKINQRTSLPVEPAGRVKVSSCQAASFPTRKKELYTSEPCHGDSDDTSTGQENQNDVRRKNWQMDGGCEDQGLESTGNVHGKR